MEIAIDGDLVHIRDSKDRSGPILTFDRAMFKDAVASMTTTDTAAW